MKVLIAINSLDTGGAEKLVLDALPKFVEKGIDISLLLLNGENTSFLTSLERDECCAIHKVSTGSVYNPFLIFRLIPYVRKYDIIHVHLFPALYWVVFAKLCSFSSTKLVFTEHNTTNRRRNLFIFKWIDRFVYSRYAKIITVSTEVKLFLKEYLQVKNKKFTTITNGVNLEHFNTIETAHSKLLVNDSGKVRTIVQVAAFTRQKDQETLLKSIPYVIFPVQLLLVGKGPLRLKLENLAQSLEIEDKVTFLGERIDIQQILKTAHVAVLSSHYEGLSLSGVEAMAAGIPLVAANVSGLKTLVHGAGILFEHRNEIDLANKINLLLSDEKHYLETTTLCIKRAQKYSLDTMVDSHIKLYNELL